MTHRLSIRNKLMLAFGLNLFFYAVLLYVNLEEGYREWSTLIRELPPLILSEYVVGSLFTFAWLFLAERTHEQFERWFGDEIFSRGRLLPNALAIVSFALGIVLFNLIALQFVFQVQRQFLDMPDRSIVADTDYARMAVRFSYANYIMLALFVYYLLTHRRILQRMGETTLRTEKAQREQAESQYAILRSRVNPHFLFNSLSTLSSLVQVDGDRSEQFIDRLSKAYRYMLENRDRQTVLLKEELAFLEAYSFLLETRFGQKFHIETEVPAELAGRAAIVPLTLQVLVDRALKNNRMSAGNPLVVRIRAADGELWVENNRQPRLEPDHTIGECDWSVFENRYRLLAPAENRVREMAGTEHWAVRLPLLDTPENISQPLAYG